MAKSITTDQSEEINERTLTKETKDAIEDIITQKKKINLAKDLLNDSIEAVAEKLGVKKGVLSRRIDLIIKEEEKGGEVQQKSADIEFVEKYFNISE